MTHKRWTGAILALALAAAVGMTLYAAAAAEPGSEEDPLVTLSYLNETYLDQLMAQVDAKIAQRNAALGGGAAVPVEGGSVFTVVTLSQGQTLYGTIGCEIMLRVGTAECVASSSPGLVDSTSGGALEGGKALEQNHLYIATIEDRGVRATAATVKVLVRGGYTVG